MYGSTETQQSTAVIVTDIQNKGEFMGVGLFSMANKGQFERKGKQEDLKKKKWRNDPTFHMQRKQFPCLLSKMC